MTQAVSPAPSQAQAITYWFDFVSPYAYIASQSIEALAARYGRRVDWRPILLGAIFKATGSSPLTLRQPIMADYFLRDIQRSARFAQLELKMPEPFPINTQNTARVCYWLKECAPERVGEFVRSVTTAYFTSSVPLNEPTWLAQIVSAMGLDGAAALAACNDPDRKEELKAACEQALNEGVFGAPWFVVDGEPFWGSDRLPQLEQWLKKGRF